MEKKGLREGLRKKAAEIFTEIKSKVGVGEQIEVIFGWL